MDLNPHYLFKFNDKSYLALIKDKIKSLGVQIEMDAEAIGKINIVATEILTNLIKFSSDRKEILIRKFEKENRKGIELISIDNGPGIINLPRAMEDGYSSAGSQGEGLGAIKRLSDEFDMYSSLPGGTVVLSRIYKKGPVDKSHPKSKFEFNGIVLPLQGQTACGDLWGFLEDSLGFSLLCLDGLGHGIEAEDAAKIALSVFHDNCINQNPSEIMNTIHTAIKQTRGAVGLVIKIPTDGKSLSYCGLGNISAKVLSHGIEPPKSLLNFNGVLGMNARSMTNNSVSWDNYKHLVVHSDGLNTRWDLNAYKNILQKDPSIIAAVMYRDFARVKDDLMIVVARNKKG